MAFACRRPFSPQVTRLFERQRCKTVHHHQLARQAPGKRGLAVESATNIEAARHGLLYEREALERFQQVSGIRVFQVGHVVHERFEWLSCCPDGITEDGRVAEVKCPYYRRVVPGIPDYCVKQLQIAMEVTDLDEAVLIQYKPASVFGVEQLAVATLVRDRTWLERNWSRLHKGGNSVWHRSAAGSRPQFLPSGYGPMSQPKQAKASQTERWSDMVDKVDVPVPLDPKILKGLSYSFGRPLTEEEFKEQQAKGGARVAKSLDLRDIGRKSARS